MFAIYLIILVWIILFKLQFSIGGAESTRAFNLIPFHYAAGANEKTHIREIVQNILIFVPFGVYLGMLAPRQRLWKKASVIIGASLALETAQYAFAMGSADITDLITNTFGGIAGLALYYLTQRLFKNKQKADTVITVTAAVVTISFIGLMAVLFAAN